MSFKNMNVELINDTFYYGSCGDFKLIIDTKTNCFNATKLCEKGNTLYSNWFNLDRTKKLIDFLKNYNNNLIFEIKSDKEEICGIWMCEELILDFALWVNSTLYLNCFNVILQYKYNFSHNNIEILKNKIKNEKELREKFYSQTNQLNEIIQLNRSIVNKLVILMVIICINWIIFLM